MIFQKQNIISSVLEKKLSSFYFRIQQQTKLFLNLKKQNNNN